MPRTSYQDPEAEAAYQEISLLSSKPSAPSTTGETKPRQEGLSRKNGDAIDADPNKNGWMWRNELKAWGKSQERI